ncbi:unnamed protein product [Cyprideis torosa]|uniref:Uncharacterized protein n=1 Tax=Cyprideis torosa TaxID=163714 RepID=A0A7R8ZQ71_9CRUS|nr:unnamed protein product [Cyprideis torosa]CAG0889986.1 unnamed protein product [Cyprideis torosa]
MLSVDFEFEKWLAFDRQRLECVPEPIQVSSSGFLNGLLGSSSSAPASLSNPPRTSASAPYLLNLNQQLQEPPPNLSHEQNPHLSHQPPVSLPSSNEGTLPQSVANLQLAQAGAQAAAQAAAAAHAGAQAGAQAAAVAALGDTTDPWLNDILDQITNWQDEMTMAESTGGLEPEFDPEHHIAPPPSTSAPNQQAPQAPHHLSHSHQPGPSGQPMGVPGGLTVSTGGGQTLILNMGGRQGQSGQGDLPMTDERSAISAIANSIKASVEGGARVSYQVASTSGQPPSQPQQQQGGPSTSATLYLSNPQYRYPSQQEFVRVQQARLLREQARQQIKLSMPQSQSQGSPSGGSPLVHGGSHLGQQQQQQHSPATTQAQFASLDFLVTNTVAPNVTVQRSSPYGASASGGGPDSAASPHPHFSSPTRHSPAPSAQQFSPGTTGYPSVSGASRMSPSFGNPPQLSPRMQQGYPMSSQGGSLPSPQPQPGGSHDWQQPQQQAAALAKARSQQQRMPLQVSQSRQQFGSQGAVMAGYGSNAPQVLATGRKGGQMGAGRPSMTIPPHLIQRTLSTPAGIQPSASAEMFSACYRSHPYLSHLPYPYPAPLPAGGSGFFAHAPSPDCPSLSSNMSMSPRMTDSPFANSALSQGGYSISPVSSRPPQQVGGVTLSRSLSVSSVGPSSLTVSVSPSMRPPELSGDNRQHGGLHENPRQPMTSSANTSFSTELEDLLNMPPGGSSMDVSAPMSVSVSASGLALPVSNPSLPQENPSAPAPSWHQPHQPSPVSGRPAQTAGVAPPCAQENDVSVKSGH